MLETRPDGKSNPYLSTLCWGKGISALKGTDNVELAESFEGWTSYPTMAPRSFEDVLRTDILEWLKCCGEDKAIMASVASAFPASLEEENVPLSEFDAIEFRKLHGWM